MKALVTTAATAVTLVVLAYAMTTALALPDVHVSHDSRECVRVVNYTEQQFSCENLPTRFNHVWVQ